MVFFDQNTPAGEWRAQARCCEEQNIALHRNIAFALAVADLLQLPDDLPLMPAVTAAMSIPICLRDPASLAHLRAVARAAARNGQRASDRQSRRRTPGPGAWKARLNSAQEHGAERAKQIFDQQLRIVRQRELVAKLERHDNSAAVLRCARTVLAELEVNLAALKDNYARQKIAN